jgi:hypothetical protein
MKIKSSVSRISRSENDPDHFVIDIHVRLFDGDKQVGTLKGKAFECYQLHESDLFWLADGWSIDLDMLVAAQKKKLLKDELVVLDTMEIEPTYRGKGYGIKMIKRALKDFFCKFSLCDANVLMHPCPLVWPDKEYRDEARKALSSYYAKHLPIKRINKSPYYHFSLDDSTYSAIMGV